MRFRRAAGGYHPSSGPPKGKGSSTTRSRLPPAASRMTTTRAETPPFPNFLLSCKQRHFRGGAEDKKTQSQVKLLIQLRSNGLLSNSRPNRELMKKNFKRGLAPLVTTMLPFAAHHILINSKTVSTGWLSFRRSQACLTMKRKRALLQLERKGPREKTTLSSRKRRLPTQRWYF